MEAIAIGTEKVIVFEGLAERDPEAHQWEERRISSSCPLESEIELDGPVDEGEVISSPSIVGDEGVEKENIDLVEVAASGIESRLEQEHDEGAGISIETLNHDEPQVERVVHPHDHRNPVLFEQVVVAHPWLVFPRPVDCDKATARKHERHISSNDCITLKHTDSIPPVDVSFQTP